jgi:hypothetical protein
MRADGTGARIEDRKIATSLERQNHYKWGNERLDGSFCGYVSVGKRNSAFIHVVNKTHP